MFIGLTLFTKITNNIFKMTLHNFKSLWQMFTSSVGKHGSKPFFHINEHSNLTYNDIYKLSCKFQNLLLKYDVNHTNKVVVIGKGSPNWAALLYATNSVGATFVPIFEGEQSDIKSHILNEINPKIIFNSTSKSVIPLLKKPNFNVFEIDHDKIQLDSHIINVHDIPQSKSDLATILYTSGTSGFPKGVMLSNDNILCNLKSIKETTDYTDDHVNYEDKFVSFLPWNHCYGLNCELNFIVSNGASIYRNNNLENLRNDLVTHNPTIICGVPRLFQVIHKKINIFEKYPKFAKKIIKSQLFGKNIRYCTVGGSSISENILDFYKNFGLSIHQGYGTTECSPMISLNSTKFNKKGSVGKILNCNKVIINKIDNDSYYSGNNKEGEILVTGSNVMSNYFNCDKNLSFETIDGVRYYKTGDIGYIDNNYLFITGRIKEQFKLSNGKFVNPSEIEEVLLSIPEIKQVVIYGKDCDHTKAIIVTDHPKAVIEEKIKNISSKLKKYEIPKDLCLTNREFTTENGLLTQKKSLKRDEIVRHHAMINYIIQLTPTIDID